MTIPITSTHYLVIRKNDAVIQETRAHPLHLFHHLRQQKGNQKQSEESELECNDVTLKGKVTKKLTGAAAKKRKTKILKKRAPCQSASKIGLPNSWTIWSWIVTKSR